MKVAISAILVATALSCLGATASLPNILFIFSDDHGWELFDLQNDPNELNNLYASAKHQPLVIQLKARLAELKKEYQVPDDGEKPKAQKEPRIRE